jgi:hypothetical protein
MERTRLWLRSANCKGPESGNDYPCWSNPVTAQTLRMTAIWFAWAFAFVAQLTMVCVLGAYAASDLKLAHGLSFDDDSSPNFPIQGRNLSESSIARGQATVIFFGTSNCWNTAREAERLVKLLPAVPRSHSLRDCGSAQRRTRAGNVSVSLLPWLYSHDRRDRQPR